MVGIALTPKPIASIEDAPEQIGEAIHLTLRRYGPHVPVNVFVRSGDVYAIRQCYKICHIWDVTYPDDFVGSYSRRAKLKDIVDDMTVVKSDLQIGDGKTSP